MTRHLLVAALAGLLAGQAPVAFEVASIRPTSDQASTQAGVQITASQVHMSGLSLKVYLGIAFKLPHYRVSAPQWLSTARFDISAKMPDEAKPQQVPDMLQTLLVERFKLQTHREMREAEVYTLEVAKGGLTATKVSADQGVSDTAAFVAGGSGSSQGVAVDLGRGSSYTFGDNRFVAKKVTMALLAQALTNFVGRPVLDQTKDDGFYDVTLEISAEDFQAMRIRSADMAGISLPSEVLRFAEANSLNSLFEALRKVGLSLESRHAPLDFLVVDHVEKAPTEN